MFGTARRESTPTIAPPWHREPTTRARSTIWSTACARVSRSAGLRGCIPPMSPGTSTPTSRGSSPTGRRRSTTSTCGRPSRRWHERARSHLKRSRTRAVSPAETWCTRSWARRCRARPPASCRRCSRWPMPWSLPCGNWSACSSTTTPTRTPSSSVRSTRSSIGSRHWSGTRATGHSDSRTCASDSNGSRRRPRSAASSPGTRRATSRNGSEESRKSCVTGTSLSRRSSTGATRRRPGLRSRRVPRPPP
jgi:hypothetical protein